LKDIIRQDILDLVVQAPHKSSTFCRVIPLHVSGIVLEFCLIGGEVVVCLLELLQFSFCCCHTICVPKSHFQNRDQGWDMCQVDPIIGDIGLDLCEGLAH
jgi:hypothetical protein